MSQPQARETVEEDVRKKLIEWHGEQPNGPGELEEAFREVIYIDDDDDDDDPSNQEEDSEHYSPPPAAPMPSRIMRQPSVEFVLERPLTRRKMSHPGRSFAQSPNTRPLPQLAYQAPPRPHAPYEVPPASHSIHQAPPAPQLSNQPPPAFHSSHQALPAQHTSYQAPPHHELFSKGPPPRTMYNAEPHPQAAYHAGNGGPYHVMLPPPPQQPGWEPMYFGPYPAAYSTAPTSVSGPVYQSIEGPFAVDSLKRKRALDDQGWEERLQHLPRSLGPSLYQ